jgi:hypothetical protein
MNKNDGKSKPTCSHCRSDDIVFKGRTSAGDARAEDVIRTEMIGCAVVYRYLTCNACGRNINRAEYERFQKGGFPLD